MKSMQVNAYIDGLDNQKKGTLKRLRALIFKAVPDVEELLQNRIPTYHYNGPLCSFLAGRNHFQFNLFNKKVMQSHAYELMRVQMCNGAIRFKSGQDLPDQTIKVLLESAVREADRRESGN